MKRLTKVGRSFTGMLLIVVMLVGLFSGSVTFAASTDNYQDAYTQSGEASQSAKNAVRVNTLVPASSISLQCGTWGNTVTHQVTVYAWNTDYATTVAGTAVAFADVGTGAEFAFLKGTFKESAGGNDKTLPAGNYLFVFSSSKGDDSYLVKTGAGSDQQNVFVNGNAQSGYELRFSLNFTEYADAYYGKADPDIWKAQL